MKSVFEFIFYFYEVQNYDVITIAHALVLVTVDAIM